MTDEPIPQQKPDFISCPTCGATYPPYRSSSCPHPILQIPISHQIAVQSLPAEKDKDGYPLGIKDQIGVVPGTAIAIIPKPPRKKKAKPQGPHVLEEPYYEQQPWEKVGQGGKRWRAFQYWISLGDNRTYAKVSRDLGYSAPGIIEQWAKQDKWPLRLDAYRARQAEVERKTVEAEWKRRAKQVLVLADSSLNILAAEANALMDTLIEKKQAGTMSVKEFTDSYIAMGKFLELLQGRATEHVTHDTPQMKQERMLRDAVTIVNDMLTAWDTAHPDEPPEQRAIFEDLFISTQISACPELDRKQLEAAVLGRVDDSSTATN